MAITKQPRSIKPRNHVTIEYVKSVIVYDCSTGIFTWQKRLDMSKRADRKVGKIAGSLDKDGYVCIQIWGRRFCAHKLAWAIVNNEWPSTDIDHINGIRTDNRWSNLRLATRQQNLRNMKKRPTNKSGYKWFSWHQPTQKWVVQIRFNGKNNYLGVYATAEEAYTIACAAAIQFHKDFARFE